MTKLGTSEKIPGRSVSEAPSSNRKRPRIENVKIVFDKDAIIKEDLEAYQEARKKWEVLTLDDEMQTEFRKNMEAERTAVQIVEKRKNEYIQKYLPDYLKGRQGKPSFISGVFGWMMRMKERLGKVKVKGRENIPEKGPYLVVSNHSGGETAALYGVFDKQPLRVTSGEELNWKRSGFRAWLLRKLGMIPVKESLSNLSDVEKAALLQRVPGQVRKEAYGRIVESEGRGELRSNLNYLRSTVAALLQGDSVAVFPEGLFLYDGKRSLRKAYGGIEAIAREYKRVSGKELPILPFGIGQKTIGIGEIVNFSDNATNVKDTDWIMVHVAKQLSSGERGVYAELAKTI